MKKAKTKIRKVISALLSMIIVFSVIPITANAAYITDIGSNSAKFGVIDEDNFGFDSKNETYFELHYATYDGQDYVVFCTQYGISSPTGRTYDSDEFEVWRSQNNSTLRRIAKYIYFGYTSIYGDGIPDPDDTEAWQMMCAAQQFTWYALDVDNAPDSSDWNPKYMSASIYNKFKEIAEERMEYYENTYPSFNSSTVSVNIGESITLTDSNKALENYPSFTKTVNGVTFKHTSGSNTLTITASDTMSTHSVSFNSSNYDIYMNLPDGSEYDEDVNQYLNFVFDDGDVQNLMFSMYVDPTYFTLNVNIQYGQIELSKEDIYGASVDGATFGLYSDSSCTKQVATATSSDGVVKFNYLAPGTYYVKEISAPDGYLLSDEVLTVKVSNNSTTKATVENEEPTGSIELTKVLNLIELISKTNGKYGDIDIEQAEYTLYAAEDITSASGSYTYYTKDEVISTQSITADSGIIGTITWDDLPLGSYYIKETTAPEGTFIDESTYNVTLSYEDQYTSVVTDSAYSINDIKSMMVRIFKSGSDGSAGVVQGLEGAEFTIKLYADYLAALEAGYTEEEIWAHENSDGTWSYYDSEGNEITVDAERAEAAQEIAPSYDVITTGSDGYALSGYLPYGKYIAKETYTPVDYTSGADFTFTISNDESEMDVANAVLQIVVNNSPVSYPVKIVKQDADSGKTVTLSSATFKIRALEDIYNTTTGELIFAEGDYITYKVGSNKYSEFMTNSDGYVVPAEGSTYASTNDDKGTVLTPFELQAGEYEIVEITAPDGYLISEESIPFTVSSIYDYDTDDDGDTYVTVTVENEQPKGQIVINKSFALRDDVDVSLIDDIDYTQVSFELTVAEDIIDMADGSVVYEAGTSLGTYSLNSDGTLTINDLWIGSYTLTEVSTIDGAVLDDTAYSVEFVVEDDTTKVYTETLDIVNYTTEVDLSKVAITGEEEIEGAELTVIDSEGNIIDSWTSTSEVHKIEGLVVGETYTLIEEYAPDGYVIASDIEFTVENTSDIQLVTMVDKQVGVDKVDTEGNSVVGAVLQVTNTKTKQIVDQWITDGETHYISGLIEGMTYVLTEIETPDGYVTASSVEFTVSYDKETEYISVVDKQVLLDKVDVDNNFVIGATLTVTDEEGNIVDEWVTDESTHYISGLVEGGTYTVTETVTPDEYVTASPIEFTVSYDKENEYISLIDKQVTVSKVDLTTGEELPGAELTVTDEDGNIIDSWTSTDEVHYVTGLEEGKTYTLTEVTAPYGYEIAESIEFTVTTDKEIQHIVMEDDYIYHSVMVNKVDSATGENIVSADFKFGIYYDADCTDEIEIISADTTTGTATFENLIYGTYYIKEVEAPEGYELSDEIVEIVINDEGVFANGVLLTEEDGVYSFEYQNSLLPVVIVNTGDNYNIALYIGLAGIALVCIIGLVVTKTKKKSKIKKDSV